MALSVLVPWIAICSTIWVWPETSRWALWALLGGATFLWVALLWRDGYTWVILWLAPIAAFDPVPFDTLRTIKYLLVALVLGVAFLKRWLDPQPAAHRLNGPLVAALALLGWIWFRALTGGEPWEGTVEAGRLTLVAAVVVMWITEPNQPGGRRRWYTLWMMMAMFQVTTAVIEATAYGHLRSFGTFPGANALGMYLVSTIALAFAASLVAPSRRARAASKVILLALLFALYLTGARAAWLATAGTLLGVAVLARSWRWLAVGMMIAGISWTLYTSNPVVRIAADAALRLQFGLTHRPILWEASDRAIERAPLIGSGVRSAGAEMAREARYPSPVHRQIMADMMNRGSAHNLYRRLRLETGLVGLLLLGWMASASLYAGWRASSSRDLWRRAYALALFGATVGILLHAYFEDSVFLGSMSASIFYWFLVAQCVRGEDSRPVLTRPSHR
jgi:O-antigen ligase